MGEVLLVLPGGSYLHFCVHVFQGHWKGEAKGQYMYMLDLGGGGAPLWWAIGGGSARKGYLFLSLQYTEG